MNIAEFVVSIEQRAADAEREGAVAPVANVYRLVLDRLATVDTTTAVGSVESQTPDELEPYLIPQQVADLLKVELAYVYRHKKELGGVKVGKYLRFRPSTIRKRLERQR